jgi:hypothetical protein
MPAAGPYRSYLLNALRRSSQHLAQQCQQQLRHLKVQAIWGLQSTFYPVYRLFHRRVSSQGQGLASKSWQRLQQWTGDWADNGDLAAQKLPAADQPIQKLLQAIKVSTCKLQTLPKVLAVQPPEITIKPLAPQRGWKKWRHALQTVWQDWQTTVVWPDIVQRLIPRTSLTPLMLPVTPAPLLIQGVAVELQTQELVLVGQDNQVLNLLSPSQQQQLQQHLTWELTEYCRQVRQVARILQQPQLLLATEVILGGDLGSQVVVPPVQLPRSVGQGSLPGVFLPHWRQWPERLLEITAQLAQSALLVIQPQRSITQPIALEPKNSQTQIATDLSELPQVTASKTPTRLQRLSLPQWLTLGWVETRMTSERPTETLAIPNDPQPTGPDHQQPMLTPAPGVGWAVPLRQRLRQHLKQRLAQIAPPGLSVVPKVPVGRLAVKSDSTSVLPVVNPQGTLVTTSSSSPSAPTRLAAPNAALETETVVIGYETHILERILAVLDQVMVWVERLGLWLWQTGRRFLQWRLHK